LKNKGQMFLISAVVIIVVLILLKVSYNLPDILERKKEMETRFENEFFTNIADELPHVIDVSYHQSKNITRNVFNFANFTRKTMNERLMDFEFLYISSLTSINNSNMNVTVVNLLNRNINVTINLNDSQTDSQNNISDSSDWSTIFNINPGQGYTLSIYYNNMYEGNVTIPTYASKDTYVGFFDINLIGSQTTYKNKFQESYTLP